MQSKKIVREQGWVKKRRQLQRMKTEREEREIHLRTLISDQRDEGEIL